MVGGNPYTEELLQLEQCAPMVARPVAPQLAVIKTPLRVRALEQALVQHPDGEFVKFVLRDLELGLITRDSDLELGLITRDSAANLLAVT